MLGGAFDDVHVVGGVFGRVIHRLKVSVDVVLSIISKHTSE